MGALDDLDGFGDDGFRILDILAFIQNLIGEYLVLIEIDIAFEQVIGGDQDIIVFSCQDLFAFADTSGHDGGLQLGRKTSAFLLPVIDQ